MRTVVGTPTSRYPDFVAAVQQFQSFLASQAWPEEIAWLTPQGVFGDHRHLVIRDRAFAHPATIAAAYEAACERSLGVLLEAIARDRNRSYCALWSPETQDQASRHMMPDGLKLWIASSPPAVSLLGPALFTIVRLTSGRRSVSPLLRHDA